MDEGTRPTLNRILIRDEAIAYFGKQAEWDTTCSELRAELARIQIARKVKVDILSTKKIRAWTGLEEKEWRVMKLMTRLVREEFGGEANMVDLTEDVVKDAVMRVFPRAKQLAEEEFQEWLVDHATSLSVGDAYEDLRRTPSRTPSPRATHAVLASQP
jgi:hypothetical protein